jgi:hypothetical protein
MIDVGGSDIGSSGTSVDPTTGLTAGSGNSTQDSLTLPEAAPQEINGSLDRNSRTSGNVTSD